MACSAAASAAALCSLSTAAHSHVYTIDTTSAFFVLAGFFAAYTFANVPSTDPHEICKIVAIYTLIDVWLAGIFDFFDPWGTP